MMNSIGRIRRTWWLLAALLVSLAIFWESLKALIQLAARTDEYTHVFLILPVSLCLLWLEGRHLRSRPAYAPVAGGVLFALSSIVYLAGSILALPPGYRLALQVSAIVFFWIACAVLFFGFAVARELGFPLLFLFLIVPTPGSLLDEAVIALQAASTEGTFLLFKLAGVPVLKNGFILSIPQLNIEVARECSGIRSSIILFITCLVLAHLFLRSRWSKALFVLFVIPMAVVKNAIRIFTLCMLGTHVDAGFLTGRLHHEGGVVFFALALLLLFAALRLLQHLEGAAPPRIDQVAV